MKTAYLILILTTDWGNTTLVREFPTMFQCRVSLALWDGVRTGDVMGAYCSNYSGE